MNKLMLTLFVIASALFIISSEAMARDVGQTTSQVSEIAFIGADGNIWIMDETGNNSRKITDTGNNFSPAWSPDGNQLYFIRELNEDTQAIVMFDFNTGQEQIIVELPIQVGAGLDVSTDGKKLAFAQYSKEKVAGRGFPAQICLSIFEIDSRSVLEIECVENNDQLPPNFFDHPRFAPSGNELVVAIWMAPGYCLNGYELDGASEYVDLGCSGGTPDYFPDGKSLVISGVYFGEQLSYPVFRQERDTGKTEELTIIWNQIRTLDVSSDGKKIVFQQAGEFWDSPGPIGVIDVATGAQRLLVSVQGSNPRWRPALFSPPPPAITDLAALPGPSGGEIKLTWSIPDVTEQFSPVISFDIRYSDQPITEENWDLATPFLNNVTSAEYEWLIPFDFLLNRRWFFAVKTIGEGAQSSSISNVPSLIDTGFRPERDGFKFKNGPSFPPPDNTGWNYYPNPPADEDFTLDDVRRMFGDDVVCQIPYASGEKCYIKPSFLLWHAFINFAAGFGHCVGMASTSLNYYENPDIILETVYTSIFSDTELTDARSKITFFHAIQFTQPYLKIKRSHLNHSSANDALEKLIQAMQSDEPVILAYEYNDVRHAVTPFALVDLGNDIWKVGVYDNNHPGKWGTLTIDQDQNTCKYNSNESLDKIFVLPLSIFNGPHELPSASDILLIGLEPVNILITNQSGQRLGFNNDIFYDEIPDAYAEYVWGSPIDKAGPFYLLPKNMAYTMTLENQSKTETESVRIAYLGSDYVAIVESQTLSPNGQDRMHVSLDGKYISYQSSESKEITFTIAFDNSGDQISLQNVDLDKDKAISIQANPETGEFIFSNAQASGGSYDLSIQRISADGEQKTVYPSIPINKGGTQSFKIDDWVPDSPLVIYIDNESDGFFDDEKRWSLQGEIQGAVQNKILAPSKSNDEKTTDTLASENIIVLYGLPVLGAVLFVCALGVIIIRKLRSNSK